MNKFPTLNSLLQPDSSDVDDIVFTNLRATVQQEIQKIPEERRIAAVRLLLLNINKTLSGLPLLELISRIEKLGKNSIRDSADNLLLAIADQVTDTARLVLKFSQLKNHCNHLIEECESLLEA